MFLATVNQSIEVLTDATATTTEPVYMASYADITTSLFTPSMSNGLLNGTTAVEVVAAPAASTQRQIKEITIYNADTVSHDITVQLDDTATDRILVKHTVAVGESLHYRQEAGWAVLPVGGGGVTDHGVLTGLIDDDHTQYPLISSQAGAPSSTPSRVGEVNVDTTADTAYVATGIASSADWTDVSSTSAGGYPTMWIRSKISNGTDATNDINIASGSSARDDGDTDDIDLASLLTKQLDAAWALGSASGGLDTGTIADDTYHVFLIKRSDTGVVDALFSLSPTAPTMPTSYDLQRRIGSIIRTGGSILAFIQNGDNFTLDAIFREFNTNNPGTSAITQTLARIPTGIEVGAQFTFKISDASAATTTRIMVTSLDQTATSPSSALYTMIVQALGGGDISQAQLVLTVKTNTSAQFRYQLNPSSADTQATGFVRGWIDDRGAVSF